MNKTDPRYGMYLAILREELLLAMGCTEPAAVACAAAAARSVLPPDAALQSCELHVSGNIIKNVKSVVVPNTGGARGLETAAAAGLAGGDARAGLQVIARLDDAGRARMRALLQNCRFTVCPYTSGKVFYIEVRLHSSAGDARAVIEDLHTNLTVLERDGAPRPLPASAAPRPETAAQTDRTAMTVEDILDFAAGADLDDVRELLQRQIDCNMAIAEEGLRRPWGAQVGRTLLRSAPGDVYTRAAAAAAAGSDARMGG